MSDEASTVRERYRGREDMPFDVDVHDQLDRASLADLLGTDIDFLHYVGHASTDGLECTDGHLDVGTVQSVAVDTFFLNACQSYRQARTLVRNGAIGGIATLSDVTDSEAATVGRTIARLFNDGYPLRVALEIARSRSVVGGQYLAVGDDSVALVPSQAYAPSFSRIEDTLAEFELSLRYFSTSRNRLGAGVVPKLGEDTQMFLLGRCLGPFDLATEELLSFLREANAPVEFEGEFYWSRDLADRLADA